MNIVKRNGVLQFSSDNWSLAGNVWNFTDDAPPPPPVGRLTTAVVTWMTHDPFASATDLTQYKNVAGVIAVRQTPIDWPYLQTQFKWTTPATKYTAFQINVPAAGAPITEHYAKGASYSGSAPMKLSLSATPGDFNPATALAVMEGVTPENGRRLWFKNGPAVGLKVGLGFGGTYYLNVVPMDNTRSQTTGLATA